GFNLALIVQKFGGSSVADAAKMLEVAKRVAKSRKAGNQIVVVVSAPGDTTDELITLAHQITDEPDEREMDVLLATGEQQSIALLAIALKSLGCDAISFTGPQVGIVTDSAYGRARIVKVGDSTLRKALNSGKVVIVAGFQGENKEHEITTLGRGGSDLTAVAIAAALKADVCEFYKDVDGVFTANPGIVKNARKLSAISYDEMLEMASAGAQVLNARSVEFAKNFDIKIHVRPTFNEKEGTIVMHETKAMEKVVISGVTYNKNEAKITVRGVPDRPGVASILFSKLGAAGVNVDMIIQNIGEKGHSDVSFTVDKGEFKKAMKVVQLAAKTLKPAGVIADEDIAKVSVIGVGMRSHSGVAAGMFKALAEEGVNIEMISTSEIKISVIIDQKDVAKAVNAIHKKFRLDKVGGKS
ncbi:MAG TPA: aspartate kinase, partial [bacterium]|nr:aspartate kinase [bacterium]